MEQAGAKSCTACEFFPRCDQISSFQNVFHISKMKLRLDLLENDLLVNHKTFKLLVKTHVMWI